MCIENVQGTFRNSCCSQEKSVYFNTIYIVYLAQEIGSFARRSEFWK